jgi:hypothetical protein
VACTGRGTRARHPYRLFDELYDEVKGQWEERFERRLGFWRGFVDEQVRRYGPGGLRPSEVCFTYTLAESPQHHRRRRDAYPPASQRNREDQIVMCSFSPCAVGVVGCCGYFHLEVQQLVHEGLRFGEFGGHLYPDRSGGSGPSFGVHSTAPDSAAIPVANESIA